MLAERISSSTLPLIFTTARTTTSPIYRWSNLVITWITTIKLIPSRQINYYFAYRYTYSVLLCGSTTYSFVESAEMTLILVL